MAGSSLENFVPANLIGSGSRVILARMSAVEGCLLYGTVPDYFPSIEDRKLSVFGYDENGNPGFWNGEVIFSRVPYALEIDGTPVGGDIEYNVTGTVSYSTGLGVNSAIPSTFQRIPNYNTKVAFSSSGAIFLDINDAADLPYGQGYFTGSQFWLEIKTEDGVSRFYGTSSGQIEDVTNWTAFTGETGANTISVSPPVDVTIAAPGQMIESLSDVNSIWFRGNSGLHRLPEIDQFGFLRVNGVIPKSLNEEQTNNVPRDGEIATLPDQSSCAVIGDGTLPANELYWIGTHRISLTAADFSESTSLAIISRSDDLVIEVDLPEAINRGISIQAPGSVSIYLKTAVSGSDRFTVSGQIPGQPPGYYRPFYSSDATPLGEAARLKAVGDFILFKTQEGIDRSLVLGSKVDEWVSV